MPELETVPISSPGTTKRQLLMNVAAVQRAQLPMVASQLNIRPVMDVHADVQGTDLGSVAKAIERIVQKDQPDVSKAMHVIAAGQIITMRDSFRGLFGGIGFAVILVYLLLVMNFQSWIDPIIVLMAVPLALGGVMWMLFATGTHISVPALMGTLMCIGLTTANSTLVVAFANQRMAAGDDAMTAAVTAGYTRLRPVLMTAGAMILGMIPMALGIGEGGEQNAPLGRAVIGGLSVATFATLFFVPLAYSLLRRHPPLVMQEAELREPHR
jgi:multidrug efflux pump subunit AcrB